MPEAVTRSAVDQDVIHALRAVDRLPEDQLSDALAILSALKDGDHAGVEQLRLIAL